jgi:hypothetical protein
MYNKRETRPAGEDTNTYTPQVPKICEGCATGVIEYIQTKDNKRWRASPCSIVKRIGKMNEARVNYCYNWYMRYGE